MLILNSLYLTAAVLAGSTTLTRADVYSGPKRDALCQGSHIFSCWNGQQCIPLPWRCDGTLDCQDGSDEWACQAPLSQPVNCNSTNKKCGLRATTACVPISNWCDGKNDCGNNIDEDYCIGTISGSKALYCDNSEPKFFCRNQRQSKIQFHRCIPWDLRCNGKDNCEDGSDEYAAVCQPTEVTCNSTQFKCSKSNFCIAKEKICDGRNDCKDKSDEEHCSSTASPQESKSYPKPMSCPGNDKKYLCANSINCTEHRNWCDGHSDCPDNSDELHCPPSRSCTVDEFKCKNRQRCVEAWRKCNGAVDCGDRSDEENCKYGSGFYNKTTCPGVWCVKQLRCREEAIRCNGVRDCYGSDDDEENCDEMMTTEALPRETEKTNAVKKSSSDDNKTAIIAAAAAAGVVLLALLIAAIIYKNKRKTLKDTIVSNSFIDDGIPAPQMDNPYEKGTQL